MSESKRYSDAELEQYLAAGISKLQADYDALRAENERSEQHRNDLADKIVSQQTLIGALRADLAALKAVPEGVEVIGFVEREDAEGLSKRRGQPSSTITALITATRDGEDDVAVMAVSQHNAIVASLSAPLVKAEQVDDRDNIKHLTDCDVSGCGRCENLMYFYQACDECGAWGHNDAGPCPCRPQGGRC